MCGAYGPHMDTEAHPDRPPPTAAHARLLRDERSERSRSLAFWTSFDANPSALGRWTESVAASWRPASLPLVPPLIDTVTP